MVIMKKPANKCAVEMKNITKTFGNGSIIANDDVSFSVYQNEIHAIVGENGAGKSTLMSILFGIYSPDKGEVKINQEVVHFKSAQDASKAGIGMVHQHFKLVQNYTLLENIILGAEITKHGFLDKKTAAEKIQTIAHQYNLPVNLKQKVSESSVGEQQRAEILKLLYREANILIFDEPTAVLSDKEIDGFLKMLLFFKKLGKTIIIITHKLNEVKAIADRATVIRQGKVVDTFDVRKTSIQKLADCMVGKKLSRFINPLSKKDIKLTPVVLNVQNLSLRKLSEPSI
jgi:simple sugar transport system ATP-binding protein